MTRVHVFILTPLFCLIAGILWMVYVTPKPPPAAVETGNSLTTEERQAGWQLLFNGVDTTGWMCNTGRPLSSTVRHGALQPHGSGGYLIVYERPFSDFVFKCDACWTSKRFNSGVFFRVSDLRNPVHTGFEVQLVNGDGTGKHDMGAIYDLVAPTSNTSSQPGIWHHIDIHCLGSSVRVKIDGDVVTKLDSDDFEVPGQCPDGELHKFKLNGRPRAVKEFSRVGHIGFQDHGHAVWFKNIKLLDLHDNSTEL